MEKIISDAVYNTALLRIEELLPFVTDEKTHEREFGNLLKIDNNFPKYVVTMDTFNSNSNYLGILHLHLREFLKLEKL